MKRILFFCAAMLAVFKCSAQSIQVLKDGKVIYECADTRGVEVVFKEKADHYGHEYVDLGLPSGIKWATMNVGATKPEEYGDYFAWGEIEPKEEYNWETYKWCNGSQKTQTKYCTSLTFGTVDGKTVLDPEDDVAHVKWGGSWRMPTKEEQDELREKCTWTWTSLNGVYGRKVTGPNGNSIFLPAAGYRYNSIPSNAGPYGNYWSSSLRSGDMSFGAYYFYFSSGVVDWNDDDRYYGNSVRAVCL